MSGATGATGLGPWQWLQLIEHELLVFALFWFILGAVDELAIDVSWLWLRLTGRLRTRRLTAHSGGEPLAGRAAVLIPAWHEAEVIGTTVRHALAAWPQGELRIYIGCYRNDPATIAAAMAGAAGDQ